MSFFHSSDSGQESTVNRGRHYQNTDQSLRQPLTSPHSSSASNLLANDGRSHTYATEDLSKPAYNSNAQSQQQAQSINWAHTNLTTFSQIAHNDPIDPNVVVVPKHPTYLSKLYRPDAKVIASEEGFGTLRVETLALCALFVTTAAIFSPGYAPIIVLCAVACVLCCLGFIGALRQIKKLVYFYIIGLIVWVLIIVTLAFTVLFISNSMRDDATQRCILNKAYFMKFNETPFGPVDCSMHSYICLENCVAELQQHLRIAYFVFGGLICIFLSVYFFRMINISKILIFPIEKDLEESSKSSDSDDLLDEDEGPTNSSGLQQGPSSGDLAASGGNGVQLPTTRPQPPSPQFQGSNVKFSSRVEGDDILLTTQNPLFSQ